MIGTHPNICVATLTCVVWELLEGAHHGTCVASLCECSLQQQLITGVRVGPAGSAVELEHELEAAEQSWYGVAPGCEVHSGCTTCDLCVISLVVYITPRSQRAEPSHSLARCLKFQRCLKSASGGHWKTSVRATASRVRGGMVRERPTGGRGDEIK